jgi:hypothetical protein
MLCTNCGSDLPSTARFCFRCGAPIAAPISIGDTPRVATADTIRLFDTRVTTATETVTYFPVSLLKLSVLCLCSFDLYAVYWFYQNWKLEQARTGEPISPFWRGLFGVLFAYPLFQRIKEAAGTAEVNAPFSPGLFALLFALLNISVRLPDPYWLICTFTFVPLLPIQLTINRVNAQTFPGGPSNSRFSVANVALVVTGGFLLLLVIVGMFLPSEL